MKTEYDADAAFLYPITGRTGTPLFMPSCYALGAERALLKKFLSLPTTPKTSNLADFCKRKTLQSKRLATLPKSLCNFADSDYSPSFSTSAISRAVAVTIRIPVSLISSSNASSCRRWVFFPVGCAKRN